MRMSITTHSTTVMAVVISTLRHIRGLAGAPTWWPGCASSTSGRTPQGRTMKITVHQMMTKTTMPLTRPMCPSRSVPPCLPGRHAARYGSFRPGLRPARSRSGCRRGRPGAGTAPACHGRRSSARRRRARAAPAATSRSRAAPDVVDLVAEVVDAALRVALQEPGDRRAVAQRVQQLDLGVAAARRRRWSRRAPAGRPAPTPPPPASRHRAPRRPARSGTAMATWLSRPIMMRFPYEFLFLCHCRA